jgi:hypothetical protein
LLVFFSRNKVSFFVTDGVGIMFFGADQRISPNSGTITASGVPMAAGTIHLSTYWMKKSSPLVLLCSESLLLETQDSAGLTDNASPCSSQLSE